MQGDLGHAVGFALVGAAEDDVGHLTAAKRLGGGLTQDPANRVDDVGFAASVGAHDGGDPLVELEVGFVGKGLEALKME